MEDGFTFAIPAQWSYLPVTEEMDAQNIFLTGFDFNDSIMVTAFMYQLEEGLTLTDHMGKISSSEEYGSMEVITNEKGAEVLVYEYKDGTIKGYEFLLDNGYIVHFMYGFVNLDKPIMEHPGMEAMVNDAVNSLCYTEK